MIRSKKELKFIKQCLCKTKSKRNKEHKTKKTDEELTLKLTKKI